jgi:predicted kinase
MKRLRIFNESVSRFNALQEAGETPAKRKQLTFMIAAPGTGKSTFIKKNHSNAAVVSADHFFEDPKTGEYKFDPKKIVDAHAAAQAKAADLMGKGHDHVIVDNTNTAAWQLKPYLKMAAKHGYDVHMQHLEAPLEQIRKRGVHFPKDDESAKRLAAMKAEADKFAKTLHGLKDHPQPMKALDDAGEFKAPWEKENGDNKDLHGLKHTVHTADTSEK